MIVEIEKLKQKFKEINIKFEEFEIEDIGSEAYENAVSEVDDFENELSESLDAAEGAEIAQVEKFINGIAQLKEDNEFYDAEAELDNMFPNRHDDDFDEDSMSYDSVFGGD